MATRRLSESTLRAVTEELGGIPWDDATLRELVAPQFGVVSGFQDLLAALDALGAVDLGETPPVEPTPGRGRSGGSRP